MEEVGAGWWHAHARDSPRQIDACLPHRPPPPGSAGGLTGRPGRAVSCFRPVYLPYNQTGREHSQSTCLSFPGGWPVISDPRRGTPRGCPAVRVILFDGSCSFFISGEVRLLQGPSSPSAPRASSSTALGAGWAPPGVVGVCGVHGRDVRLGGLGVCGLRCNPPALQDLCALGGGGVYVVAVGPRASRLRGSKRPRLLLMPAGPGSCLRGADAAKQRVRGEATTIRGGSETQRVASHWVRCGGMQNEWVGVLIPC